MKVTCKPEGGWLERPSQLNSKNIAQNQYSFHSPQKQKCLQINFKTNSKYKFIPKSFGSLKRTSDKTSILRQTVGPDTPFNFLQQKIYHLQEQKPNNISQFLRQTVGYKGMLNTNMASISESLNQRQVYKKIDNLCDSNRNYRNKSPQKAAQTKPLHSPIEISRSSQEYDKLNEKIANNKKMIEQLRKNTTKQDQNLLKNVYKPKKWPAQQSLDRQKQISHNSFKKNKDISPSLQLAPKTTKATYEARFHSSPFIQVQLAPQTKAVSDPQSPNFLVVNRKQSDSSVLAQFTIGKKLGQGKFGGVSLVRHKKTGGVFALKKISKSIIKSHSMVQQVAKQIRLQSCLNHKNILSMYGFYDDKTHLYIVLQYMDGGTLFQQLKKGKLTQKQTAKVMRQITQAVQYLHDLGIAHRDLKPQNIVISNDIYKLCDFGWAAMCNERRTTYCGTFDYVAPQILEGVSYDMAVDLWCLGVLAFELMTGRAPFYDISKKETMKKILNVQQDCIVYPRTMSASAIDFIDRLIRKQPAQRSKATQALKHPFLNCLQQ